MNNYHSQFNELDSYFSKNFLKNNAIMDSKKCINCSSVNSLVYDYNTYNKICKICGSIDDTIRDESAEWRFYGYSDSKSVDPSRCGGIPINDLLPKSSMGTTIGSGNIINDAKLYYKMLSEKNEENANIFLTRGNNRNSLIVACLYISSKNNKKPFKEKNILKIFNISKSDLTKGLKNEFRVS